MFRDILLWGLVVDVIHFIVVGFLYMNPLLAGEYKKSNAGWAQVSGMILGLLVLIGLPALWFRKKQQSGV